MLWDHFGTANVSKFNMGKTVHSPLFREIVDVNLLVRLAHCLYPWAFCTLPSFASIKRPRWQPIKLND